MAAESSSGYSTGVETTYLAATAANAATLAGYNGKNVDNYTTSDFIHAADSGDSTAATNQGTKKNRTLWL